LLIPRLNLESFKGEESLSCCILDNECTILWHIGFNIRPDPFPIGFNSYLLLTELKKNRDRRDVHLHSL